MIAQILWWIGDHTFGYVKCVGCFDRHPPKRLKDHERKE